MRTFALEWGLVSMFIAIIVIGIILFFGAVAVSLAIQRWESGRLVIPPSPYHQAYSYPTGEIVPCHCSNGAYLSHFTPGYHGAMQPVYKACPSCINGPKYRTAIMPAKLPPADLILPQSQVQWRIGFERNRDLSRPEQEQKVGVYYLIWNLPGWYLDGTGSAGWGSGPPTTRRYWDGQQWTDRTK